MRRIIVGAVAVALVALAFRWTALAGDGKTLEERVAALEAKVAEHEARFAKMSTAARLRDAAEYQMKNLSDAIDMYYLETKSIPTTLDELTRPSKKTNEPYVDKVPLDPWGQPYVYKINNVARRDYTIQSSGEDKQPGSDDDLFWPKKEK